MAVDLSLWIVAPRLSNDPASGRPGRGDPARDVHMTISRLRSKLIADYNFETLKE
jgi:hypothetical protein